LLRTGVDWEDLDGVELCDVIYSMIIDDVCELGVARVEAREAIDKRLADNLMRANAQQGIKQEPEPFRLDPAMAAKLGIKLPTPAGKQS
jgi:hypothetical protein